jgi:4-amino-4-deoxy-L-arabinose transferase-like glycosyltransferase
MSAEYFPYRAPAADGPAAVASPRSAGRRIDARAGVRRLLAYPELLAVLAVAGALNLWNLSENGYANTFYAAAVKSMAGSWHDFLFASMDKAGLMTIDKPPLAYWIQALVVRVFGYSSWSLLVPQAIMGVIAAALMYDLTRRRFGRAAGFAAGLVLATTPTIVAVSRHNNPDELLVLLSVAAVWFTLRALETGRTRHLVWAGVMVGLGFETKMGVALMLVPAIAAAWVWMRWGRDGAGIRGKLRVLGQLLWGGLAMAAVGLAWPLLVTLTPAADRPWISGTSDNSIWSLIVSYNGLGRIDGQTGGPGGAGGGGGGGGAGSLFGGNTGIFRLLQSGLGDQGGWLLGFALGAGLGLVVLTRLRRRDPRTGFVIVLGGTLLTVGVVFSFASGIFHPYYVSMVAPWAAALIGAGVGEMLPRPIGVAAGKRSARILGPVALLGGAVTELVVLGNLDGQLSWAEPLVIVVGIGAAGLLTLALSPRLRVAVVTVACTALLAAPAAWAAETLSHPTSGTFPTGGPTSAEVGGMGGPGGGGAGGFGGRASARHLRGAGPGSRAGGAVSSLFGGGSSSASHPAAGIGPGSAGGAGGGPSSAGGGAGGGPGSGGATSGSFAGGFGGSSTSLLAAARYAKAHGGGTVAVDSQSTAAQAIVDGATNVAGIGGFSGRESTVTAQWLALEVRDGRLRWLLADGTGGQTLPGDTRTGSADAISIAESVARKVTFKSGGQTVTLYDLQGKAAAILAAAAAKV